MELKRLYWIYAIIALAVSAPFVVLHLMANPDDAPISVLQHCTAAAANYFGPWGALIVRLVDFPNGGLRGFKPRWAILLTLLGGLLLAAPLVIKHKWLRFLLLAGWAGFLLVWFVWGALLIADGLL